MAIVSRNLGKRELASPIYYGRKDAKKKTN